MTTYKNIRLKMKGGKTRLQRVMVLASGKYKFVKNLTKKRSGSPKKSKTTRKSTSKKGGKTSMGRRGKSPTQTIWKLARLAAGTGPAIEVALRPGLNVRDKFIIAARRYTGYDFGRGTFMPNELIVGYGPLVATVAAQKGVSFVRKLLRSI